MDARVFWSAGAGMALAGSAIGGVAESTMFVTNGTMVYRVDGGGSVEAFDVGVELNALTFDNAGRLWGTESTDHNGDQSHRLFEITDPFGVGLGAVSHGDFIPGRAGSLSFRDGELMAFDTTNGNLLEIDAGAQSTTLLSALGDIATRPQSSAYDPVNDILYGIRGTRLYEITMEPAYEQVQTQTLSGFTGGFGPMGGDWFDGTYYHSINDGSVLTIYTVDVKSGVLTEAFAFDVDGKGGGGLAVGAPVPAPAGAGLLAMGGVLAMRRRR